ncbi:MAG: 30S ribosomal protein S20 [Syntrophaceae bacterium]|nr:30S ribosomal protein S20 [Syntrophaceae bacterium]
MATHKSAEKRNRQNKRHRKRNIVVKSALKTNIKSVLTGVSSKNKEISLKTLKNVIIALNKAASKGIIHKKNASRKISRLTQKVNALK